MLVKISTEVIDRSAKFNCYPARLSASRQHGRLGVLGEGVQSPHMHLGKEEGRAITLADARTPAGCLLALDYPLNIGACSFRWGMTKPCR